MNPLSGLNFQIAVIDQAGRGSGQLTWAPDLRATRQRLENEQRDFSLQKSLLKWGYGDTKFSLGKNAISGLRLGEGKTS
jgi:hypothetical protein